MPQVTDYDSGLDGGNTVINMFSLSDFNRKIASIIIQPVPEDKSMEDHKTNELLQRINE